MPDVILLCTVGGSHEPILTAIREAVPSHVCFFCSGPDPATGKPGSEVQINGKGNVIKKHRQDTGPTLPNIPTQAGLGADQYETVPVRADDLDDAFATIREALAKLSSRFPQGRFLADYTGGTKTMTAALVTAALESENVELQLVTGSRTDLVKVRSGMESATPANVERIRLERAIASHIAGWRRFAYGEAASGLSSLRAPRDPLLKAELQMLRDLSRAFDAWDRFDHQAARTMLDDYRPRIGPATPRLLDTIKTLTTTSPKQEPARLFDLWLNAQRRAAQGRYDDAVARVYRLLEWIAQWILRSRCGIDTADIPAECAVEGIALTRSRDGKLQAGLFASWSLVEQHAGGAAADFARTDGGRLLNHIKARNDSILAHGFTALDATAWQSLSRWVDERVIPMLSGEAATAGLCSAPIQLPIRPEWSVR